MCQEMCSGFYLLVLIIYRMSKKELLNTEQSQESWSKDSDHSAWLSVYLISTEGRKHLSFKYRQ